MASHNKNLRVMAQRPRMVMHSRRLTRNSGSTPRTIHTHRQPRDFGPSPVVMVTCWYRAARSVRTALTWRARLGEAKRTRHTDMSTQYNLVRFGVANVARPIKVETQAPQIICICTFLLSSPQNEEVFHILYTTFYKFLTLLSSFLWRTRHERCGPVTRAPLFKDKAHEAAWRGNALHFFLPSYEKWPLSTNGPLTPERR